MSAIVLSKVISVVRSEGIGGLLSRAKHRISPPRDRPFRCFADHASRFKSARGLEIGGPSHIFTASGAFPVYPLVGSLDNCNYSSRTIWEGDIKAGRSFTFDQKRKPGIQHIAEATDLRMIGSGE